MSILANYLAQLIKACICARRNTSRRSDTSVLQKSYGVSCYGGFVKNGWNFGRDTGDTS